jgi:hypothetical protein
MGRVAEDAGTHRDPQPGCQTMADLPMTEASCQGVGSADDAVLAPKSVIEMVFHEI